MGIFQNSVCADLFCVATLWCDPVLCMISAQFRLVTHRCVKFIPNLKGVERSRDLAYALAIPWCWASLACSTAFIFEPTLIRLLIYPDNFQISYVAFHSCSTLQCPMCPYGLHGLRIVQASLCGLWKIITIAPGETWTGGCQWWTTGCGLYHCAIVACYILLTCAIYVTCGLIGKHIFSYWIWDI